MVRGADGVVAGLPEDVHRVRATGVDVDLKANTWQRSQAESE